MITKTFHVSGVSHLTRKLTRGFQRNFVFNYLITRVVNTLVLFELGYFLVDDFVVFR